MERLVTGTIGRGTREVPAIAPVRRLADERRIAPIVADPLPGESTDWAFFGLLAFTALLFFRPQDQVPGLASLHLAEFSAIGALVAMAGKRLIRGLPISVFTPELGGLIAFGAVLVVTTPFSYWPGGSVEVITGLYVKVLLIVVLMANSLTTPRRLQRFISLVVVASSYIAARAVFDYVRGVNLVEDGRVAGAVSGIFGNPNDLALNMVAFLPFAALFVLRGPRRVRGTKGSASISLGGLPPAIALGACGLMFLAAIFTKSRAGFLGMAVMALVLVWHARKIRRGLGIAALVATVIVVPLLPSSFWGRMVSIVQPEEDPTGSRAARRTVMTEAAMVFLERPLTGIGAGQFKNYNPPGKKERWREAHDVWLQVASETGIVGLLVFVYLVWAAIHGATWSRKRVWALVNRHKQPTRPWASNKPSPPPLSAPALAEARILHLQATALVASLAGWIVCATFASVAYNWTFYYLLGLCIATRRLAGERELS